MNKILLIQHSKKINHFPKYMHNFIKWYFTGNYFNLIILDINNNIQSDYLWWNWKLLNMSYYFQHRNKVLLTTYKILQHHLQVNGDAGPTDLSGGHKADGDDPLLPRGQNPRGSVQLQTTVLTVAALHLPKHNTCVSTYIYPVTCIYCPLLSIIRNTQGQQHFAIYLLQSKTFIHLLKFIKDF